MVDSSLDSPVVQTPRLARNYVLLSAGELVAKVLGAVAFAYLARVLGPEEYGSLEFTIAVTFVFTLVVDCGLSAYTAREIAKDKGAVTRYITHIVFIRSLLAIGSFLLLAIFALAIDMPWPVRRLILLYGLTLFGVPGLLQGIFQGLDWMHYVAIASVIRWTVFAGGVFAFVRGAEQTWAVPLIEGCAIGGQVIFYFWSAFRCFGKLRGRLDRGFALSTLRQAFPVGASEWVWAIKTYFATVWLGLFVGGPEVGWFGAAHRIVVSLHTFVWLYFFNLLPSMSRCTQEPIAALRRLMRTSMQVTAWSAVFLGIVGTAFAEPLMMLLYGESYRQATTAFQWLIWLIPLTLLHGHYRYALIAYGRQRLEFLVTACGAGMNVALSLLLIPAYGLTGSAWALVASELFIGGLAYYLVRRNIDHIPFLPCIYRPLFAGAILVGVLYVVPRANVLLAGGLAVLVYGLMLVIVQPKMIRDVRSMLARGN